MVSIRVLVLNSVLVITPVFYVLMFNPNLLEENFSVNTQASVTAGEKLLNLEGALLTATVGMKGRQTRTSCITGGSAVTVKHVLCKFALQHPESVSSFASMCAARRANWPQITTSWTSS